LVYFIYHLIQGNHGWLAWRSLEQDLATSHEKLKTLKQAQETLRNKVNLLQSDSLDEDMLDERIRLMLGDSREDEIIIMDEEEADSSLGEEG
jgi:cell division protein FtsB